MVILNPSLEGGKVLLSTFPAPTISFSTWIGGCGKNLEKLKSLYFSPWVPPSSWSLHCCASFAQILAMEFCSSSWWNSKYEIYCFNISTTLRPVWGVARLQIDSRTFTRADQTYLLATTTLEQFWGVYTYCIKYWVIWSWTFLSTSWPLPCLPIYHPILISMEEATFLTSFTSLRPRYTFWSKGPKICLIVHPILAFYHQFSSIAHCSCRVVNIVRFKLRHQHYWTG